MPEQCSIYLSEWHVKGTYYFYRYSFSPSWFTGCMMCSCSSLLQPSLIFKNILFNDRRSWMAFGFNNGLRISSGVCFDLNFRLGFHPRNFIGKQSHLLLAKPGSCIKVGFSASTIELSELPRICVESRIALCKLSSSSRESVSEMVCMWGMLSVASG